MTRLSCLTVLDPALLIIRFLHGVHALVGNRIEAVRSGLRRLRVAEAEVNRSLLLAEEPDLVPLHRLELAGNGLVIVNILFLICSIPVITFGAAYSAKYYVAMKVIRGEGT